MIVGLSTIVVKSRPSTVIGIERNENRERKGRKILSYFSLREFFMWSMVVFLCIFLYGIWYQINFKDKPSRLTTVFEHKFWFWC